ncbi:unnamed protein product [Pleuronectes platessa]|uniref:Uncharacterized protein n=1 Tax=Pleuronectes platessa TaxID=8262 RepID=A0A9N7UMK9_PLEPL|nr:unnamed protein product [Pleuronectes platessa]
MNQSVTPQRPGDKRVSADRQTEGQTEGQTERRTEEAAEETCDPGAESTNAPETGQVSRASTRCDAALQDAILGNTGRINPGKALTSRLGGLNWLSRPSRLSSIMTRAGSSVQTEVIREERETGPEEEELEEVRASGREGAEEELRSS